MKRLTCLLNLGTLLALLTACTTPTPISPTLTFTPRPPTPTPTPLPFMSTLSISLGQEEHGRYVVLTFGGDADTEVVLGARRTGNGRALVAADGNSVPDFYIQFDIENTVFFASWPTPSVKIEIEYLDERTDTFTLQYDGLRGGPYRNGKFLESRPVYKTDSKTFKTAVFILKDVYFGDRDNGADFRISDQGDGPETIRKVTVTLLPVPNVINVDDCGANPWDGLSDSESIQTCINRARNGDTVTFTSGENSANYRGYLIDKTIFLVAVSARKYLTFTSTNPSNPALLQATASLKGYVIHLFALSRINNPGEIDYITISHLHLDGNRAERTCLGKDGISNGRDDNWGSYLPECTLPDEPWCRPGTLHMAGAVDWSDASQNYQLHPDRWSTGHLVEDLHITNTECGTALGMNGAGSVIMNTSIETAGDHVHADGCAETDDLEGVGDWSDTITFDGPDHLILNNTVVDPSDIGIVFFGGRETVIHGNTIRVTAGNHGAYAAIAIHPWGFGDNSFGRITGNTVINEGDQACGGLHVGINLAPHEWGGACRDDVSTPAIGNASCSLEPVPPGGALCPSTGLCQVWISVSSGATYLLADNHVTGAHINYLVEGLDLLGTLIESNNLSTAPRPSDWSAAQTGCNGITWEPTDKIAHHPSLPGWTDLRIHCE